MHIFCNKIVKTRKKRICYGCKFRFDNNINMRFCDIAQNQSYKRFYMCECCDSYINTGGLIIEDVFDLDPGELWTRVHYKIFFLEFWMDKPEEERPEEFSSIINLQPTSIKNCYGRDAASKDIRDKEKPGGFAIPNIHYSYANTGDTSAYWTSGGTPSWSNIYTTTAGSTSTSLL